MNGKLIEEDYEGGNSLLNSRLARSTDVVCSRCGSPLDGLIYDSDTDTFIHRRERDCHPFP